jgi:hypothetical protein
MGTGGGGADDDGDAAMRANTASKVLWDIPASGLKGVPAVEVWQLRPLMTCRVLDESREIETKKKQRFWGKRPHSRQ